MRKLASRGAGGKNKNYLIGRLRIGDLNKLFAHRYGGPSRPLDWQFPEDDAGLEDLKVLIHHYHWTNPLKMPRIIKLRAPWADAEAIICEVESYEKKWRSATLGRELNLAGVEWRKLRPRTIAPVDMSKEERHDYSRILSNGQRRKKRRMEGMRPRKEYEFKSLSQTKPWVAEGISRATWYRRRTQDETSLAGIKITMDRPDLSRRDGLASAISGQDFKEWAGVCSPTQKPPLPDLCQSDNFNPILSWLCLRAAYHHRMGQLCDVAAEAA